MNIDEKKALYESIMSKVAKIVKQRINQIYESENAEDDIYVVFTGKSAYFEGDKVEKFIKKETGAKCSHYISDKTTYLVTGEKPGPNKVAKAKELGIKIMTEEEFYKKFNLDPQTA